MRGHCVLSEETGKVREVSPMKTELGLRNGFVLASLALLILNDHVLKGSSFPEPISGKLSDFAGLFFFPFFVTDCLRILSFRIKPPKFDAICLVTGITFMLLKVSPLALEGFLHLYRAFGMHAHVMQDHSDLWALTVLPLAGLFERSLQNHKQPLETITVKNKG